MKDERRKRKLYDWDLSINKYRKEKHEETVYRPSKDIIKEAEKEFKKLLEGFEELEKVRILYS